MYPPSPILTDRDPGTRSQFRAVGMFAFNAEDKDELAFAEGEELIILDNTTDDAWWLAQNAQGKTGMVPFNYVKTIV